MSIKPDSLPAASWWRKVREALGAVQGSSRHAGELMLARNVQPVYEIGRLGVRRERELQQEEEVLEFGYIMSIQEAAMRVDDIVSTRLYLRGYKPPYAAGGVPVTFDASWWDDFEVLGYGFGLGEVTGNKAVIENVSFGLSAGGLSLPMVSSAFNPALNANFLQVDESADLFSGLQLANSTFNGQFTEHSSQGYYGLPQRRQAGEVLVNGVFEPTAGGAINDTDDGRRTPHVHFSINQVGDLVFGAYMLIKVFSLPYRTEPETRIGAIPSNAIQSRI